jgi:Putative bacterial sensory transduction regulator
MPDERIVQQVNGILSMNNIKFLTDPSDGTFLVPQGSAGVFIKFVDWSEGTLVGLQATVLSEVDGTGERRQKILEALNEKNRTVMFGCFYFQPDDGCVVLDYHLLGDHLQADELMNALGAIASTADAVDEELREAIGSGVRATDVWQAAMGEAGGTGENPVVTA